MSEKNGPPSAIGFVEQSSSSNSQPSASAASAPPAEPALMHGQTFAGQPYPNSGLYPDVPPPSYQNAMEYPSSAPYGQPPMNAAYPPKPMMPVYYPSPNITVLPQPPQPQVVHIHANTAQPARRTQVVVISHGPRCRSCNLGTMQRRMDMCCLITLIVLCIFTFPFGLIFLCCIPCAHEVKCSNCGRSN